jgi:hypothetical protein
MSFEVTGISNALNATENNYKKMNAIGVYVAQNGSPEHLHCTASVNYVIRMLNTGLSMQSYYCIWIWYFNGCI